MIKNCIFCNKELIYHKSLLNDWISTKCNCKLGFIYSYKLNDIILIYLYLENYSLRFTNFINSKYYSFSIDFKNVNQINYNEFNLEEFINFVKHNIKNFEESIVVFQ